MSNPVSPDKLLRRWLVSLPGHFDAAEPAECYHASYKAAAVSAHCSLGAWRDALHRAGFVAKEVRPGLVRLRLTEPSVGVKARSYHG